MAIETGETSAAERALTASPLPKPQNWLSLLLIVLICLVVYYGNMRVTAAGDSRATALIPVALLTQGNLRMDKFAEYYHSLGVRTHWFAHTRHGWMPYYPVATGVLIAPLYIIPVYSVASVNPTVQQWIVFSEKAEKAVAPLIVAASAVVLFLLAQRLGVSLMVAWCLTIAYAFGSQAWVLSSQSLWAYGPGALSMLLTLLFAVLHLQRPTRGKALLYGLFCALTVAIRPQMALFSAPAFLWMVWRRPHEFMYYAVPGLLVGNALALYNLTVFGNLAGGYGSVGIPEGTFWEALLGLLFSPGRGLLVYFPLTLLGIAGAAVALLRRCANWDFYAMLAVFVVLHTIVLSSWHGWWAGWTYGPRYMTEIQPALILLTVPLFTAGSRPWLRRLLWAVFSVFLVWSVTLQFIGAYLLPNNHWDASPINIDDYPNRAWGWRDTPYFRGMQVALAYQQVPPQPLTDFRAEYQVESYLICRLSYLCGKPQMSAPASGSPMEMRVPKSSRFLVAVTVRNTGSQPWTPYGKNYTTLWEPRLAYHIRKLDGSLVLFDGRRTGLDRVVYPGQATTLVLEVAAPDQPGSYWLEVSLVQEAVAWFEDKGTPPARVKLLVVDS
jgi:hypothetical protein